MPYHDRTKARLENEVSTLRHEVVALRSKQKQRRQEQMDQAVLQARLEQEIHELQTEVETLRLKRKMRESGGTEHNKLNQHIQKLDEHVTKQEHYIKFLEEQINRTRTKYQQRMTNVHQSADQLEEKLKKVRHEMRNIKEQAGEVDQLNKRVTCLSAKLERRDKIIAHYEAQHADFMKVIADLEKQVERQAGGDGGDGKEPKLTYGSELNSEDVKSEVKSPSPVCDPPKSKPGSYFASLATALRMKFDDA
ncbi:uncharacterized protein [Drosophila kikkawai]|uniref:Uncharacterized protein n=1 Tax=Drosophila kikkawai TaxID=30033 RepID=A0A6P4I6K8_DROKI|nr:myosin heavy chain, muscle [Drosophila kikkawai]